MRSPVRLREDVQHVSFRNMHLRPGHVPHVPRVHPQKASDVQARARQSVRHVRVDGRNGMGTRAGSCRCASAMIA
jgi:hypothetical protein